MRNTRIKELELIAEAAHKEMLNEGLLDALQSMAGGAIQNIKESIATKVLNVLGVDTDATIAKVFINFIGNLEIEDIRDMLTGDNKCLTATGELSAALTETMIEEIPGAIGIDTSGAFAGAVREALGSALSEQFSGKLAAALCDIDFSDALDAVPGVGGALAGFIGK